MTLGASSEMLSFSSAPSEQQTTGGKFFGICSGVADKEDQMGCVFGEHLLALRVQGLSTGGGLLMFLSSIPEGVGGSRAKGALGIQV